LKYIMKPTTILFDIGWVIIDETIQEKKLFDVVIDLIEKKLNIRILPKEADRVIDCGVNSFASSLFSYFIWHFVKPNVGLYHELRREFNRFDSNPYCRIFPDIPEVLEKLAQSFKLGYAANQKSSIHAWLEKENISKYFGAQRVSGDSGFKKPDLRHFTAALEDIGSTPEETIMVGDRIDNDIIPAKLLGMTTVQHRIGRHKMQKPRSPEETPDYVIDKIPDLLRVKPIAEIIQ